MKNVFYVKWTITVDKGIHRDGIIDFEQEKAETYNYARLLFANNKDEAARDATKNWRGKINIVSVTEFIRKD